LTVASGELAAALVGARFRPFHQEEENMAGRSAAVVVVAVSGALGLAVAGCGSGTSSSAKTNSAGQTVVKVGVPLSLSGPVAFAGVQMQKAMKLGFKDANASLAASGIKLEPVFADDKSDQPTSIDVTRRLVQQDKVAVIAGYTASNICQAALPVAQQLKVPALNADCVIPDIVKMGDYIFRTAQPLDPALSLMTTKVAPQLGLKSSASLVLKENPGAVNAAKIMSAGLAKAGAPITDAESVRTADTTNFRSELTRIASKKPGALVIAVLGGQAGQVMVQARQSGLDVPFIGEQNLGASSVIEIAGKAAANTYFATYWNPTGGTPKNDKFIKDFKAAYNAEPDTFAANGYAAVETIAAAVKKAGKPSGDAQSYREKLKETLGNLGEIESIYGDGKLTMKDRAATMGAIIVKLNASGNTVTPEVIDTIPGDQVFAGWTGN
jgi:branched-chain amino acid transport system substrate-binding protein